MLFTSKSVADCFSTTPRAPSRIARTTSRSSSAAVSTTTRVGSVSKFTSSRTASPSLSGMRKSNNKISGFSFASSLMHSAPFCASPTIVISSSESKSFRKPFHVVECFTVNLENLSAHPVRRPQLCRINQQIQRNRGLVPVPLRKAPHQVHQVRALHPQRPQVGHRLAQLGSLVLHRLLKIGQRAGGQFGSRRHPPPQHIQLNLDAQQRLQNAIVQVARNAAALRFDSARTQVPQQKNIFERRPDMLRNTFQPHQILLLKRLAPVQ